ncbi:MAG: hypothetical protein ABIT04_13135 [Novosphingobium sp.]
MTGQELAPPNNPLTRLPPGTRSLGRRSRKLKWRHRMRKFKRACLAVMAIWVAALVIGFVGGGIGIGGVMATFFTMMMVFVALLVFPRMRVPEAAELRGSGLTKLAGRTEVFLEARRPMLPRPAQGLLDRIGVELDQLSPQLVRLDEGDPAAREVRRLLGEHLPELIESYQRIPEPLRRQAHAGSTPEQQLVGGLEVIAREIETMTGEIARGELDALATRGRYLELKYVSTDGE